MVRRNLVRCTIILVLALAPLACGRVASAQTKGLTQDEAINLADRILDIDEESPDDAEKALKELKELGDDGIWDMLQASKDLAIEDQAVLAEAIAALGKGAVNELVATFNDEDEDVRQTVLFAFEALGTDALPALAKILATGKEDARLRASVLIAKLDEDGVPALVQIVKDGPPEARNIAAATLMGIGGPAIKPLVPVITGANKDARNAAFSVLLRVGGDSVAAASSVSLATQDLIKSNVAEVRECAVVLLGKYGGAEAMPKVLDALCSGDDAIRDSAAECASLIGGPAVPDLIHCLNSSDGKIVEAAADALAVMGEPAVPQLTKMLRAPVVQVRGNSACALGRMKRRASVPDLAPLLGDEDKNVRAVTKGALEAITGEKLDTKDAALAWFEKHKDDPAKDATPPPK